MFNAIVLAGTGRPDLLTEGEGIANKAFIKAGGKFLISYVLDALKETTSIEKIVLVGPVEELVPLVGDSDKIEIIAEQGSILENVAAGLASVDQEKLCLVVTGDIPLIRADVIEEFILSCSPHDKDFYYPVLTKETCLNSFPETERTYVRLREGFLTGGNIGLVRPEWYLQNRHRLELFISYRKKPLKLLRILPFSFIVKYIFKTLSVKDLEKHLSAMLNLQAKAVFCRCAEIGVDVDKPVDLELVRRRLS